MVDSILELIGLLEKMIEIFCRVFYWSYIGLMSVIGFN